MGGTVTWLGHSTIKLVLPDERVILVDPWLRDNPACPDAHKTVARCDLIAITHGHFDHVGDTVALIARHNPQVVANYDLCGLLGLKSPTGRFAPMNVGGTQVVDGVRFSMTRAYHSSGVDSEQGPRYAGVAGGYVIQAAGVASFYHAGDTDVFSDMKLIASMWSPQVAALPMGDVFTMGPVGAALAVQMLSPASVLPIHYGTYPILTGRPEALRDALPPEWKSRLLVPNAGQPMRWHATGLSLGEGR